MIAKIATPGIAIYSGEDTPKAVLIAKIPKPTCDKPSPIILYLFRTKLTPSNALQMLTATPTIIALCINVKDNISLIVLNTYLSPST